MVFKGGKVVNNSFEFEYTDILVENGKITGMGLYEDNGEVVDCRGKTVIPGLFDIHTHDCYGYQLAECTLQSIQAMADFYGSHGVTSYLATLDSQPDWILERACRTIGSYMDEGHDGATVRGIHLEGLFFNEKRKGGHPAELLQKPDIKLVKHLNEVSGNRFKLVCVAPELEGADEFIEELSKDMMVSLAHTDADYQVSVQALLKGAGGFTHLFNGMKPFSHREPGVIGAALDSETAYAEVIADGMHLAPAAVRLAAKIKGSDHLVFISDSCMATGLSDGIYEMGVTEKRRITVEHGLAHLEGTDTICGSTFTLFDMFCNAVLQIGIDFMDALKACTINPARMLGMDSRIGSVSPGKDADLLLLDEHMNLERVYIKGKRCGCKEHGEGGKYVF